MTTETIHGLKETKELVAGVVEAFKVGKAIRDLAKDGVNSDDIMPAIQLVQEQAKKVEIYAEAIKDVKLVKEEIKDLDKQELLEIIMLIVAAVEEVEKA